MPRLSALLEMSIHCLYQFENERPLLMISDGDANLIALFRSYNASAEVALAGSVVNIVDLA